MPMQLWIGGRRIDSLAMLREQFVVRSPDETTTARFDDVLGEIADGIFVPWLDRCDETREKCGGLDRPEAVDLSRCRVTLLHEPDLERLSKAAQEAVATICGVPVAEVAAAAQRRLRAEGAASSRTDDWAEIMRQPWYRNDESARRTLGGIRRDRVAVDSSSLARAIARAADGDSMVTVYLCDVGRVFVIGRPERLVNVRLLGFGNPNVHFAPTCRGGRLDLRKQNVKFAHMRLNCQGLQLVNDYGRCDEDVGIVP